MQASAAGVTALTRRSLSAQMAMPMAAKPSRPMLHSLQLPPFVDELPLPERIVAPHGEHTKPLRITMREIHTKVHRDVPPTRMWSYGSTPLAPLIEARSGQATQVEWVNQLPTKHFLPVDFSLHGCGHDVPEVRACVHLHGGKTPSADDGAPDDWFVPGKSRVCHYPLQQDAAMLWYHDHAMGLNRLNIYAGLAGMFLVRDAAEDALNLPSGKYELPLTFYDRNFTDDGQLLYLDSGDPEHPWVPEFEGDAILINGKIRPYVHVEPRTYRLRLLNAANSRFFELTFADGVVAHQIGSDQGLLAAPVPMHQLTFGPAERADILVDFSQFAGKNVHMKNAALEVLEFRVAGGGASPTSQKRDMGHPIPSALRNVERMTETAATVTRQITLNEYLDKQGNSMLMLLNKKHWHEPVTETPKLGATEIWEFVNLTEDTHPMHLHMVRFQLLNRRLFDVFAYRNNKGMHYEREPLPPEPNEMGWKDVVQCPPGTVTRIIVKFDGYAGDYLYHCHVLEHEANDMMRPFRVIA